MKTPLNKLREEIIKTLDYIEGLDDEFSNGQRITYEIVLEKIEAALIDEERTMVEDAVTYGNRQSTYDGTEMLGKHYYKEFLSK